jgi:NTF2 fold immunity protein
MSKKTSAIACIITLMAVFLFAAETEKHNYKPKDGYVPDATTAIKIAVAVWEPIYGETQIAGEKPYTASLANGTWIVEGSLPQGWRGGVAIAEIAKDDGRILRVSHGK